MQIDSLEGLVIANMREKVESRESSRKREADRERDRKSTACGAAGPCVLQGITDGVRN